jgi:5-methylcytosine-specific restriction endonuclease McrA
VGKRIDLVGQKFGRWTVVERAENGKYGHSYYLCRCDCDNEKIVRGCHLINGTSKSCGCSIRIDLTGQRFYRLTVIKFSHMDKHKSSHFLCECDCSNVTVVRGAALISGLTRSCGCLQKEIVSQKIIPESEHEIRKKDLNYRNTKDYKEMKKRVWEDCFSECQICNKPLIKGKSKDSGEVAHVKSLKDFNYNFEEFHNISNLILLCRLCHNRLDIAKGEYPRKGPNAIKSGHGTDNNCLSTAFSSSDR